MIVYLGADYRCYATQGDNRVAAETDFFTGKCQTYIEGYRFVPAGETWVREDGVVFRGEMIAPWKPWEELDAAQRDYEREQLTALASENDALVADMAQMVEEIYQSDTEMMGL